MLKKRNEIGLIVCGAILLCYVAGFNNFPLVYSDTADYLGGAFNGYIPVDRPVFYGIFIKVASLNRSLWLPIAAQGLLVSYLLFETFGMFYRGNKRNLRFMLSIAILTAFTGISNNTALLLPDIFSPIGILCFINLLLNNRLNAFRRIFIALILMLCVLVHFSNMLALVSLWLLLLVYAVYKKIRNQQIAFNNRKLILCGILVGSAFITVPLGNYVVAKKFVISQGAHVIIMNHLVETGILEKYLDDQCGKKNYKICSFKNNIDTNFIWGSNGTLVKMGGWEGSKQEFNEIIFDIMTTPKYELMVLQRYAEYAFMQFFTFTIPENTNWGVPPYIKNNYSLYGRDFCASLQSQNKLNYNATNEIQKLLVLSGFAVILFVLFTPFFFNMLGAGLKWFILLILTFMVVNAAVCANFSTVSDRYQNRLIWLIPLTAFFIIDELIKIGRQKKDGSV